MRLLVTGGSSFVGAWFCLEAAPHHDVFAVHLATPLRLPGVTAVRANLQIARDVERLKALRPDAVVHLAAKVKGAPAPDINRAMMDAVLELGCPVVYASSTVVHWEQLTPYGQSRREDEHRLATSGLPFAVMRPSAPYGPRLVGHRPSHTESFHTLARFVRAGVVPIIGNGRYTRQPVHVSDLSAVALALLERGLQGQHIDVGGGDALEFCEVVDAMAASVGRRVLKVRLPKQLFVAMAKRSRDFEPALVEALDSDERVELGPLIEATGVTPRTFAVGARDLFS